MINKEYITITLNLKTSMIRSNLCDYIDAYIHLYIDAYIHLVYTYIKGTITVLNTAVAAAPVI